MRAGGAKFRKKQKEPEQPWSPLSEDAAVIKYLLWLAGERTEFGKWDQLKALEYTESTSRAASCRKLGNIGCSFALFLCSAQKPPPQSGNPKFPSILHDSSLLCTTTNRIFHLTFMNSYRHTEYFMFIPFTSEFNNTSASCSELTSEFVFARSCDCLELWNGFTLWCKGCTHCPLVN